MAMVTESHTTIAVAAILLLLVFGTGLGAAQEGGQESNGAEGELLETSGWAAVVLLLVSTVVLVASVELLIHALVRTAVRFGISVFLMAVIFSGWEFDNVAVGLFTGFAEMQNVAFGLAIGNAISIFGLTLALGAIAFPFVVDISNDYLAMTITAPLLLVPIFLFGSLTRLLSIVYIGFYIAIFAYVFKRERSRDRPFMQSDEVKEAATAADGGANIDPPAPIRRVTQFEWFWPSMLLVAVAGIVIGAEGSVTGVEGILATWNVTGTFIGVTLVTVLYTVDDLLLVLEPLRLGYPNVAAGGIIGSLLFFVTANVGIVGLLGTMQFRWEMAFVHLPSLLGFAALGTYMLWRGEMTRKHGALLLGLYVLYLLINIQFFATLPVGE